VTIRRAEIVGRPAVESARLWPGLFRLRDLAVRVPMSIWLAVFIALSAMVRYSQLLNVAAAPWIFPDELIYSELAKSLGTSGHFSIRDVPFNELSFGITYPALIAPAYALTDNLPHAYAVARAINCVVMTLAAVPAYLLGRRLLSPPLALLGAVLAVEIPSMAYSATIMSENLFYPVFLLTVLVIVRALERPTVARQLVALFVMVFAILTRLEAVAFIPAFVAAIALGVWLEPRDDQGPRALRRGLASYRTTWVALTAPAAGIIALQLLRGRGFAGLLGAYESVLERYSLLDVPKWFIYHLADLDLYVGIAPFAAALVLTANVLRGREQSKAVRVFAVTSLTVVTCFTLLVAAYATQPPAVRIHERYLFHVIPLFLIALLIWIDRQRSGLSRTAGVAALAAALLPVALPFGVVVTRNTQASTPGLIPWGGFTETLVAPSYAWAIALALGLVVGALFLTLGRRYVVLLPAIVLLNLGVLGFFVNARYGAVSSWAARSGAASDRDWIDQAVGEHAVVTAFWPGRLTRGIEGRYGIWENEIFNRSVGPVYDLREPLKRYVRETRVRVDPHSGVVHDLTGRVVAAQYVLTDVSFPVVGRLVARDVKTGMAVYSVNGLVRATNVPART
jgi:hypothetical protein